MSSLKFLEPPKPRELIKAVLIFSYIISIILILFLALQLFIGITTVTMFWGGAQLRTFDSQLIPISLYPETSCGGTFSCGIDICNQGLLPNVTWVALDSSVFTEDSILGRIPFCDIMTSASKSFISVSKNFPQVSVILYLLYSSVITMVASSIHRAISVYCFKGGCLCDSVFCLLFAIHKFTVSSLFIVWLTLAYSYVKNTDDKPPTFLYPIFIVVNIFLALVSILEGIFMTLLIMRRKIFQRDEDVIDFEDLDEEQENDFSPKVVLSKNDELIKNTSRRKTIPIVDDNEISPIEEK